MKQASILLLLILFDAPAGAVDEEAQNILREVRLSQPMLDRPLEGRLRTHGEREDVEFKVTLAGQTALYEFSGPNPDVLLTWDDEQATLYLAESGEPREITGAGLRRPLAGSALTLEDLTLHFLYWRRATLLGEESLRGSRCWKIRVDPPAHGSTFGTVLLWIDQKSRALMRAEGYDWEGRLVKRFEVVSGQRLDGNWFLKQLRVEEYEPQSRRPVARTYLEIEGFADP